MTRSPNARVRNQVGAVSAEYAAVTAAGVSLATLLIKLFSSDFGQSMLEMIIEFFLKMIGVG